MSLADLVQRERARQGLSLRQVAERSGGLLSTSTVHAVEQGRRARLTDETLDGLAKALDLQPEQVRRAAGVRPGDTLGPFVLPRRFQRLTVKERDLLVALGDALLDAQRARR